MDLRHALGAVEVPRDVVRVSGPEAVAYLQGQLSQNVDALGIGSSAWSFVLQPTGKVDAWGRITRTADDTFVIDVDSGAGDALTARLQRFLLRTKAEVERLDWRCVAVRGPGAREAAVEADVEAELLAPAGWPEVDGVCLLGPSVNVPPGIAAADADSIEALRIISGVPVMGNELTDKTIPAEVGQWVIDASVDFTKGCFTGQELVARIDSRGGQVPRNLRGIVVEGDSRNVPAVGTDVVVDGKAVGAVTSAAFSPTLEEPVALAFIARAVEAPAPCVVGTWAGQIRPLPL